jgi:hypothetical protein
LRCRSTIAADLRTLPLGSFWAANCQRDNPDQHKTAGNDEVGAQHDQPDPLERGQASWRQLLERRHPPKVTVRLTRRRYRRPWAYRDAAPTAIAAARTLPPMRIPTICIPAMPGNSTDTVRIKESITRTAITAPVNRLMPRVFT